MGSSSVMRRMMTPRPSSIISRWRGGAMPSIQASEKPRLWSHEMSSRSRWRERVGFSPVRWKGAMKMPKFMRWGVMGGRSFCYGLSHRLAQKGTEGGGVRSQEGRDRELGGRRLRSEAEVNFADLRNAHLRIPSGESGHSCEGQK